MYNLTGKKFGKWLVLREDTKNKTNKYWVCECECGRIGSVTTTHLTKGNSRSCRECYNKGHKGKLLSRTWSRILDRCKKNGHDIDVTKEWLYDLLYKEQKCKCALTGVEIKLANTNEEDKHGESSASPDRIDSSKGYVEGNVQWVHKSINKMKWDFPQDEFINFCNLVTKHNQ